MEQASPRRFAKRRAIGKTGFVATRIGIGDLADRALGIDTCVATLVRALDAGLDVVDTAPQYEDGFSEEIVGRALRGRRDGVFLIDKIDHLESPVAPQVDASLGRLGLDGVDLFAFHNVSSLAIWEKLVAPGGGFDQLEAARVAGKTRFVGISSHHPDVLDRAIASGRCDVLMFPVGPFVHPRYIDEILPRARAANLGVVSFKTFGAGKLLGDVEGYGRPLASGERGLPRLGVDECIRYTLTLDPDVALCGLSTPEEQDAAFDAVERFRPLDAQAMADVRARAARAAEGKGKVWWDPA